MFALAGHKHKARAAGHCPVWEGEQKNGRDRRGSFFRRRDRLFSLKAIASLLSALPILDGYELELAGFIKNTYFCTFFEAAALFFPPGSRIKFKTRVMVAKDGRDRMLNDPDGNAAAAVSYIESLKDADYEKLRADEKLPGGKDVLELLMAKGVLLKTAEPLPVPDGEKRERFVELHFEKAQEYLQGSGRNNQKHKAMIALLTEFGTMSVSEALFLSGQSESVLKTLEKRGVVTFFSDRVERDFYEGRESSENIGESFLLSDAQQGVFDQMRNAMREEKRKPGLLFGVTGSGKTYLYLALAKEMLSRGKRPYFAAGNRACFPALPQAPKDLRKLAAVIHGEMSLGKDTTRGAKSERARQSWSSARGFASFLPLGISGSSLPTRNSRAPLSPTRRPITTRWRLRRRPQIERFVFAALFRTPKVESFYRAKTGAYHLFALKERYGGTKPPQVILADMTEELKAGNRSQFSRVLQRKLKKTWENKKQGILYLNRRGYSTFVSCANAAMCSPAPLLGFPYLP